MLNPQEKAPTNGAKPPQKDEGKQKPHKPTDDEIGNKYINRHREHYAWFYERWNVYEHGVWTEDEHRHRLAMWRLLIDLKKTGLRPNNAMVNSVLAYAVLHLRAADDDIERGENFVNLRNGVYNLDTNELEAHQRELYLTSQLDFEYDPKAECPTWRAFLDDVLRLPDGSGPDKDLQTVVRQAFGYSLTASTEHRASFWLTGPSASGKSTLMNVLIALAGDSHMTLDLDELQNNSYQLADVPGKRVVTFTEPSTGTVLADGHYKRLVSNDTITARQPYGKPFRFVPRCKVWGAMNETPRVLDRSDAVFSRVLIIPMNYSVPPAKRDTTLQARLIDELPGIFNWALEGLAMLRDLNGFVPCRQIDAARNEYRQENDTEGAFIEDWIERDPQSIMRGSDLYRAYKLWCEINGVRPKSSRKVAKDWVRLGFPKDRDREGAFYSGLKLNEVGQRKFS